MRYYGGDSVVYDNYIEKIETEENMAVELKTPEEVLLEEIEKKEQELEKLREEIKSLERFKQYEDTADEIKAMHDAFMNSGFDEEKAFTLVRDILIQGLPIAMKQQLMFK